MDSSRRHGGHGEAVITGIITFLVERPSLYAPEFVPEFVGLVREFAIPSFMPYLLSVMRELIYWVPTVFADYENHDQYCDNAADHSKAASASRCGMT